MHGLIHVILKDLVVTQHGAGPWDAIVKKIGLLDDSTILDVTQQYDDSLTVHCIEATSAVLGGISRDTLRAFGKHFVTYVFGRYVHMFKSMGDTLPEFLQNVNHLHYNLERKFRESNFPVFRLCYGEEKNRFTLSYSSQRGELLAPIVEGVLPELSRLLHNQDISMVRIAEPHAGFNVTWTITCEALDGASAVTTSAGTDDSGGFVAWHQRFFSLGSCCLQKCDSGSIVEFIEEDRMELDALERQVRSCTNPAALLMRATPASSVAAAWDDAVALRMASAFWSTKVGSSRDYAKSMKCDSAHYFVTHSWNAPDDWPIVMGQNCQYGDVKATELRTVAEDIAEDLGCGWSEVTFWIDKCCIPQKHALMHVCVGLLEEFIHHCDGMVVLLSWEYFSRLWCVYEWATSLVYHDASCVRLCVNAFLRPRAQTKYVEAIRDFSIDKAQCYHEPDRLILKAKAREYYHSEAHFEAFARGTAIALMATAGARKASRGAEAYAEFYLPWIKLADELGYKGLSEALGAADPIAWRMHAVESVGGGNHIILGKAAHAWQEVFTASIDEWFNCRVQPLLIEMKEKSCIGAVLSRMLKLKSSRSFFTSKVGRESASSAKRPSQRVPFY